MRKSTNKRRSSFKSSTTSMTSDPWDDPTEHIIVKIRRSKEEFVGEYIGRQLVKSDALPKQTYKDIVVVDKDEPVIQTLQEVYESCQPHFDDEKWFGMTRTIVDDEVQNYKLWVDLNATPIGKHRFRLRSLKITDTVLQLHLKLVKSFDDNDSSTSWVDNNYQNFDVKEIATIHNLCEVAKFSAVVILSIITLAGNFLWYCGDFTVKMTHELSRIITVLTPIIFELFNFMSKCVGGMYWLLYMIWRGIIDPRPLTVPPLASTAPLALTANNRSSYSNYQPSNSFDSSQLRKSYPQYSKMSPPLAIMPNPRRPVTLNTSTSPGKSLLKTRKNPLFTNAFDEFKRNEGLNRRSRFAYNDNSP